MRGQRYKNRKTAAAVAKFCPQICAARWQFFSLSCIERLGTKRSLNPHLLPSAKAAGPAAPLPSFSVAAPTTPFYRARSMFGFFESEQNKKVRSHIHNLAALARVDGHIDEREMNFLVAVGKKNGLSANDV